MTRSDLIFRCPLCNVEFSAATVADGRAAMRSLLSIGRLEIGPDGEHLRKQRAHPCDDGRIGVAEFVGINPTPGREPEAR